MPKKVLKKKMTDKQKVRKLVTALEDVSYALWKLGDGLCDDELIELLNDTQKDINFVFEQIK